MTSVPTQNPGRATRPMATLRAAWDAENPRVTVEVEYVTTGLVPPGVGGWTKTGGQQESARRTVRPDNRQQSARKTQTDTNRGRIGTGGGLVLNLNAVL